MYSYEKQKPSLFTESGQVIFLRVRDTAKRLLKQSGAFTMGHALGHGDSWQNMACVDRLVELGEIREIPRGNCADQDRVFVEA